MNRISKSCLAVLLCGALGVGWASAEPTAPEQVQPLLLGSSPPEAEILDLDGKSVRLADVVAGEPTLLIFFRGGW